MYQWKKLICGAVALEETERGILPRRFTQRQLQFYRSVSGTAYDRAVSTAGVRMEFLTSEEEISFRYEAAAFCRDSLSFDIYEDGVLCGTVKGEKERPAGQVVYRKRNPGKSRITIYFPYTCDAAISDVQLGEIEYPAESKPKYLAVGDSITQGMDAKFASFNYPSILARKLGLDYLNHGVGGFYFDPDSLDEALPFQPELITVAYGVNDCFLASVGETTRDTVYQRMVAFMDKLSGMYPDIPTYFITPVFRTAEYEDEGIAGDLKWMRGIVGQEAAKRGFAVVKGEGLIPHDPSFFGDGTLHPNEAGFLEYAIRLLDWIERL